MGYTVGQVPSNLCLKAIGAPWLTIILVGWGLVSALGCLIATPNGYIVQRLILGIVESGTFPGMLLGSSCVNAKAAAISASQRKQLRFPGQTLALGF